MMHPAVFIAIGGALLLLALSQGKEEYSRALVVGDSHSEADWTLGGRLATHLKEAGFTSAVVGNRGKGVKWYLDSGELQRQVGEFRPDLLIVALGANDAGNVTEGPYKEYLAQFVDQARGGGVKRIIWLGPSKSEGPQAHRMAARNDIVAWQSQALPPLGVTFYDSLPMTVDLPTRDGVHYRHAEYTVWAARAADIILDEVAVV